MYSNYAHITDGYTGLIFLNVIASNASVVTPATCITNLAKADTGLNRINWNGTNPNDGDFSHVYFGGIFVTNTLLDIIMQEDLLKELLIL